MYNCTNQNNLLVNKLPLSFDVAMYALLLILTGIVYLFGHVMPVECQQYSQVNAASSIFNKYFN